MLSISQQKPVAPGSREASEVTRESPAPAGGRWQAQAWSGHPGSRRAGLRGREAELSEGGGPARGGQGRVLGRTEGVARERTQGSFPRMSHGWDYTVCSFCFADWFLSLSNMRLRFFCVFSWLDSFFFIAE